MDSDQAALLKETDPAKANLIITSAIKKIDTAILEAVTQAKEGKLETGKRQVMGFVENGVGIAENDIYTNVFPADLQAKVEEIKKNSKTKRLPYPMQWAWRHRRLKRSGIA